MCHTLPLQQVELKWKYSDSDLMERERHNSCALIIFPWIKWCLFSWCIPRSIVSFLKRFSAATCCAIKGWSAWRWIDGNPRNARKCKHYRQKSELCNFLKDGEGEPCVSELFATVAPQSSHFIALLPPVFRLLLCAYARCFQVSCDEMSEPSWHPAVSPVVYRNSQSPCPLLTQRKLKYYKYGRFPVVL